MPNKDNKIYYDTTIAGFKRHFIPILITVRDDQL